MKKLLILAAIAAMLIGCGKKYTINGDVSGLTGSVILINEKSDTIHEATVTNGKFTMSGKADKTSVGFISNNGMPIAMLFIEPGTITISGDMENGFDATGTICNDKNTAFNEEQMAYWERFFNAGSDEERQTIAEELKDRIQVLMDENLDNYFGLYLLTGILNEWDTDTVIAQLDKFSPEVQASELAQEIRKHAEIKSKTEVGKQYTDISLPDADGNTITLSSVVGEGKYVLLDFWASWCTPCMMELPYLVKAYENYNDKGFEIYGVSLDQKEADWKRAMEDNRMTWFNVSALENEELIQSINQTYAIESIPANFLIGPDGTIVAKDLRGTDVETKLAELFGE